MGSMGYVPRYLPMYIVQNYVYIYIVV